jgi:predicted nucleotidyltransferase
MNEFEKDEIKHEVVKKLKSQTEITKIVLFGSFLTSLTPNDLDLAIFQNSKEKYITLAVKYRNCLDSIARIIALDIIPIKVGASGLFMNEINSGEVLYECS